MSSNARGRLTSGPPADTYDNGIIPFSSVVSHLNVLARIVAAECSIEDGAADEAHAILSDLEDELRVAIEREEWKAAA